MNKILLGVAIAAGLSASAAGAATLNFVAEANTNGERGVTDGTTLTFDGLGVTFNTGGNYAYFDASSPKEVALGGAGLGVCKVVIQSQCAPSGDDNITSGEKVTLSFDKAQTLSDLLFNQDGHFAFAGTYATDYTLLFAINGGTLASYSFEYLMTHSFADVNSVTFGYGGDRARQFYIGAATTAAAVPLPAGAPLLLAALGMLGLGAARRRKH